MQFIVWMKYQMKLVILITLHRRYYEFVNSINNIKSKSNLLGEKPSIFVIWSDPEPTKQYLLDDYLKDKTIELLITRLALPNETGKQATTFYESQNIRLGLENVFRKYPECCCIVQASDIIIHDYGYDLLINEIRRGSDIVAFYWSSNAFHTNCFSIVNKKNFWPPFARKEDRDVLEVLWNRKLNRLEIKPNITIMSNYNSIAFSHNHITENLKPFPSKEPLIFNNTICYIEGTINILQIILSFFRCIILGVFNGKNCH